MSAGLELTRTIQWKLKIGRRVSEGSNARTEHFFGKKTTKWGVHQLTPRGTNSLYQCLLVRTTVTRLPNRRNIAWLLLLFSANIKDRR